MAGDGGRWREMAGDGDLGLPDPAESDDRAPAIALRHRLLLCDRRQQAQQEVDVLGGLDARRPHVRQIEERLREPLSTCGRG